MNRQLIRFDKDTYWEAGGSEALGNIEIEYLEREK